MHNTLSKIFSSKKFRIVMAALGFVAIALLIFRAGMIVGFNKASFSYGWDERYRQTFGRDDQHPMRDLFGHEEFTTAHGVAGTILKIEPQMLVVIGRDNIEKDILVNDQTLVLRFRDSVQIRDLKIGDRVVVVGAPDTNSRIEARLIRVLLEAATSTATAPKINK